MDVEIIFHHVNEGQPATCSDIDANGEITETNVTFGGLPW